MARTVTGARGNVDGPGWNEQISSLNSPLDTFFGFLGGGPLEWVDPYFYYTGIGGGEGIEWAPAIHVFDFAGSLDNFSISTFGNDSEVNTAYVVRKSATGIAEEISESPVLTYIYPTKDSFAETAQFVVIPPMWGGRMVCLNEAAEFVADDAVLCRLASEYPGVNSPAYGYANSRRTPGLADAQVDIVTADVPRTVYNTTVGQDYMESYSEYTYAAVAIGGGGLGFSWYTYKYVDGPTGGVSTDADWPMRAAFMLMRSRGTFSYLQASGWGNDIDGGNASTFFRLGTADPLEPVIPSEAEAGSFVYAGGGAVLGGHAYAVNHADEMEAFSGDLVSLWSPHEAPGYGALVHKLSLNWRGTTARSNTDWILREDILDSYQRPESISGLGDYATYGNYWDYVFLDGSTRYRRWYIHPMGPIHPHLDMRGEEDEDNPLRRAQFEVVFTEARTISRLRAFVQSNTDGRRVTLGVMVDGVDSGVTVTIDEEGWVENEDDFVDVPAGGRVTLFAEAVGSVSDRGDVQYFDHARVHIATIMFSYGDGIDSRECFERVIPAATAVTKQPCSTHRSRCVKITRTDGEVYAFTEHDEDIVYDGVTYNRVGGVSHSANELGSILNEVGNLELSGASDEDHIKVADLFGGKFDGAAVVVQLIPWGAYQATEDAITVGSGVIGRCDQDNNRFRLEALSTSAYLKQKAMLDVVAPTCRYTLGDSRCTVVLPSISVTGSVTALTDEVVQTGATVRRRFYDSTRAEADGWFDEGTITFTSGANVGQTSKVKVHAAGELVLWEPLVNVIAIGDTYTLSPGCDKIRTTCSTKFDNFVNFGGFPTVPGFDATAQTPTGKLGA